MFAISCKRIGAHTLYHVALASIAKLFKESIEKLTQDIVRDENGVFLLRCKCGFITKHATINDAATILLDRIAHRQRIIVQPSAK